MKYQCAVCHVLTTPCACCLTRNTGDLHARITELEAALAEAKKDTERLDKLERLEGSGLISDDFGHWAVSGDGFQNAPENQREIPKQVETTFIVKSDQWRRTIREAIDDIKEVR